MTAMLKRVSPLQRASRRKRLTKASKAILHHLPRQAKAVARARKAALEVARNAAALVVGTTSCARSLR